MSNEKPCKINKENYYYSYLTCKSLGNVFVFQPSDSQSLTAYSS